MHRRNAGFVAGSGPPAFTAITISFPIRVNCFAILSHRANIVAFLTSKILPIQAIQFVFLFIWGCRLQCKDQLSFGLSLQVRHKCRAATEGLTGLFTQMSEANS
jgi:hypothetical protein